MNQTGLSQSMQPLITSNLLMTPDTKDQWLLPTLPFFPSSVKFFNSNKIPYVFAFSPLKVQPENLKYPSKSYIPRCKKCDGLPSEFCKITSTIWRCPICEEENPINSSIFLPRIATYDITLKKEHDKPLFLFIFQCSSFFVNDASRNAIGMTLDTWAHSMKTDVAMVALNQYVVTFNLSHPSSQVFIEPDFIHVPISSSKNANFLKALNSLKPANFSKELFYAQITPVLKRIRKKKVCLCIFADLLKEPDELDQALVEILDSHTFSIHLFTSQDAQCPLFAKKCERVRLFEETCPHLIAPILLKFLQSGFFFNAIVNIYYPPSFEFQQIYSRRNIPNSRATYTVLDGQSSIIAQLKMRYSPQKSMISFQVCVDGIMPNGNHVYRVLSFVSRSILDIQKFDGVVFGCYIARKIAADAYFESIEVAYKNYHQDCITLISAWSDEGNYRRAITSIFRDVPILLYALQNSDLFRKGATKTESVATMINLLGSSIEEMRRMLYPIMILPPMGFPHRLQKKEIGGFKLAIFLRAYDGVAIVFDDKPHTDEITSVSQKFSVPITIYNEIEAADRLLIEDNSISFAQYAEKLEVEVNGRRF